MYNKINIEDSFYPHFKALIDSLVERKQIAYVENSDYNPEENYPKSVVLSSIDAVRKKVLEVEKTFRMENMWRKRLSGAI